MEKNQTMTDEQLARELQNGKRGGGRGKLLTVIGCAATAIGIFTSVTALTVIGIVVALLGQGVLNKHQKAAGKAVFESLVPEIMNANFEDVQPIGKQNLVDIKGSNIPLPSYVYDSASGRIDFTYRGLTSELCTVTLTDVDEYRNENNDMMESAERVVYNGQWMACELGKTYPAELTFWPRGKLDKLFRAVANTWASTTSRQMREYLAVTDVHAPDKLRCNRVLQTLPEFYTTYGIQPGDGMWTAPETRVSVW